MIAPTNAQVNASNNLKDYLVRRVRPDGGREIVAETALLSEARSFPALLDAEPGNGLGGRDGRHDSVEAATGRLVYPGSEQDSGSSTTEVTKEVLSSQPPNTF